MTEEQNKRKYYLIRTDRDLVEKSTVGIGWSDYNFSNPKYNGVDDLIEDINNGYGIGRWGNQIRRFFAINKGDIIVVPLPGCVAIGIAGPEPLFYDDDYKSRDKANQRHVEFNFDNNELRIIHRTEFSEGFQRRLRVPGIAINDLSVFKEEIDRAIKSQEGMYTWSSAFQKKQAEIEGKFKERLLVNIRKGRTNLKAGGIGLEHLVKELLEKEGYDATILGKKEYPKGADADVKASKVDTILGELNLLVQVKHHYGISDNLGISQLREIKKSLKSDEADYQFVFVTSAEVNDDLRKEAEDSSIIVFDGEQLVEWICGHIGILSSNTKRQLGIFEVPTLTEFE